MSTSWKHGDRALCIDGKVSAVNRKLTPPEEGVIYLVDAVREGILPNGTLGIGLVMAGLGETLWNPNRFRKIVPQCDRIKDEFEWEVLAEWEGKL